MMQTYENELSMDGFLTKAAYSLTAVNSDTWGSYDMGKSGAWKTCYCIPRARAKRVGNKV